MKETIFNHGIYGDEAYGIFSVKSLNFWLEDYAAQLRNDLANSLRIEITAYTAIQMYRIAREIERRETFGSL